ncbi:hypothetical protein [Streptomyces iconiensis]|uniref:Integral membrane protein n=1 Tax=Streptomyces iconiensis TaxID=1384038 RepID=A0ABT7A4A5_9ACTN|nr:hypothetical protein [Streptomyces iconiensis]MDJ1136177.1 hypothetical protein [Streptomyces iconiensis]
MTAGADLRLLRAAVFAAVCVTVSAAGHIFAAGASVPFGPLALGFICVFGLALLLAGRERSLPGIAALLASGQLALHILFSSGQAHTAGGAAAAGMPAQGSESGAMSMARKLLCNDSAMGMSEAEAHRVVTRAGLSPEAAASAGGAGAHAGHAHGGGAGIPFPDTPFDCLRGAAHAALGMLDPAMLLGHLAAAVLLGWLLRRGEAALWRLVRLSAEVAAAADERVAARALRAAFAYVRALHAELLPDAPEHVLFEAPRDELAPRSLTLQHSVHRRGPPPVGAGSPATRADSLTLAA